MAQRKGQSRTCAYSRCSARSRDSIPGRHFFSLPTRDPAITMQWLENSGISYLAEGTEFELKRIRICSDHFPRGMIGPNGRLKRGAIPVKYADNAQELGEGEVGPAPADHAAWLSQKRSLMQQIRIRDNEIIRLRERNAKLQQTVKKNRVSFTRMKNRMEQGVISDDTLVKAVARRVQGFIYSSVIMQLFHKKNEPYRETEKDMAMTMHYTSPSLYTKMREFFGFTLPSPAMLKIWFGSINLWPGVCPAIFEFLKFKVSTMDRMERQCVFIFDEVKLKKDLEYNQARQKIEGFQDLGSLGCSEEIATSALTFMVRGLFSPWKQPIGYFLTAKAVSPKILSQVIDLMLDAVISAGLTPRAMVCDQGSNNQSVVRNLVAQNPEQDTYFTFRGQKIFIYFDIPHVFKNFRNQLLKYNIRFTAEGRMASWSDVRKLFNLEKDKFTRAAVKLSEKHVNPGIFQRMNCRLALQVFSRRVAAALMTAGTTDCIDSHTVMDTACFFTELNDVFDNLNSRSPNDPNPNRCALSEQRPQIQANLEEILERSAEWRTVTPRGDKIPPCFQGFRKTVKGILELWEDLKEEGVNFLMTSRLNQDPLENLFSMIRCHGGTYNQNPTPTQFRRIFQKNIVLNLLKPAQSANCIDDEDDSLLHVEVQAAANNRSRKIVESTPEVGQTDFPQLDETIDDDSDEDDDQVVDISKIIAEADERYATEITLTSSAIEYLAGYIAKKAVDKTGCQRCRDALIDPTPKFGDRHLLVYFRAYETHDGKELGHMTVATSEFSFVFNLMNAVFDAGYPQTRAAYGIQDTLFKLMKSAVDRRYIGWFDDEICGEHRKTLAYNFIRVKINKDVKWLGQRLRFNAAQPTSSKTSQKLTNLRSA